MAVIKKWAITDAENLAKALSNKKIQDNLRDGLPYPYTKKDAEQYIEFVLNAKEDKEYQWAICDEDTVIGSIGASRKENIHRRTAEIGYYISEEYWGCGITTQAIKEVCDHLFNNTDIIRIFAEPFSYNLASCRVLEKAGFKLEGTLRSSAIKNGKVIDMNMYSLIKKDE